MSGYINVKQKHHHNSVYESSSSDKHNVTVFLFDIKGFLQNAAVSLRG